MIMIDGGRSDLNKKMKRTAARESRSSPGTLGVFSDNRHLAWIGVFFLLEN